MNREERAAIRQFVDSAISAFSGVIEDNDTLKQYTSSVEFTGAPLYKSQNFMFFMSLS